MIQVFHNPLEHVVADFQNNPSSTRLERTSERVLQKLKEKEEAVKDEIQSSRSPKDSRRALAGDYLTLNKGVHTEHPPHIDRHGADERSERTNSTQRAGGCLEEDNVSVRLCRTGYLLYICTSIFLIHTNLKKV
jgi:hypothetical protein